ncbi:transcriptional regulator [Pandoraea pneumonica]|jgi:transcriptional regulator with XRE-family HTH domain|uniref:Transcriptional regulator n=1 Tax=Pandoraea pneumonica TaxID=2508299 RepID=A0A5E4SKS0_9BURK|nr:XRE family transcriptional regulator [Pandoraea pneumonica]VVD74868.1 transcriptional regulator [Pandoraea pneumonica]
MPPKPKTVTATPSTMPTALAEAESAERLKDDPPVDPAVQASDMELGMRLRAMRTERKFTLKDLAARTNMSIGMLSQIERGVSSPSMRSLRQLCHALGVDGAALFASTPAMAEDAPNTSEPSEFVVWASQRKPLRLAGSGVTKARITPSNCASLEAFMMELEPGAASDSNLLVQSGDKVGYVLSGQLRVFIDDTTLVLGPGDTYGFTGNRPYRWENAWDEPTVFMVVNSNHFYV